MSEDKLYKYKGKTYSLDTAGVLRLIQRALTDRGAKFSRADKAQLAAMLEPLIFKVVAAEKQVIDGQRSRDDDGKEYTQQETDFKQPADNLVLYDRAVHQVALPVLLSKLRRSEEFPLSEILPESPKGAIPVTVDGGTMVIFDSSEVVRVRAFLRGDALTSSASANA